MTASIEQSQSPRILQRIDANEQLEHLKATLKSLEGLIQDQDSLINQRVDLAAALYGPIKSLMESTKTLLMHNKHE